MACSPNRSFSRQLTLHWLLNIIDIYDYHSTIMVISSYIISIHIYIYIYISICIYIYIYTIYIYTMIIAWSFFRPFKVVFTGHRHRVLGWLLVPGKGLRVEVTELQVICLIQGGIGALLSCYQTMYIYIYVYVVFSVASRTVRQDSKYINIHKYGMFFSNSILL